MTDPRKRSHATHFTCHKRFFRLTADTDLALALWAFPHDLGSGSPNAAMDAVSLRYNDGMPKPALAVWQTEVEKFDD